ncbi:MAG: sigma-70 family RNA polymerase sigma factor [Phocaeicola sp.]
MTDALTEGALKEQSTIEEEISANQLSEFIDRLINELPERQREIFILNRKSHLSYKEIAEKFQISPKTVEANISKSLKFLKEHINIGFLFFLLP